jgi:hypothetical protein
VTQQPRRERFPSKRRRVGRVQKVAVGEVLGDSLWLESTDDERRDAVDDTRVVEYRPWSPNPPAAPR